LIWTLLVLGVTALFSFTLSAQGLWRLQRGQPGRSRTRPVPVRTAARHQVARRATHRLIGGSTDGAEAKA
jgi:hypothetical protein